MTAGLGCGAVFLPFGQGRNDWLYKFSRPSCVLSLDTIHVLLLCPNRSIHLTCVANYSWDAIIISVLETEVIPFQEGLRSSQILLITFVVPVL